MILGHLIKPLCSRSYYRQVNFTDVLDAYFYLTEVSVFMDCPLYLYQNYSFLKWQVPVDIDSIMLSIFVH